MAAVSLLFVLILGLIPALICAIWARIDKKNRVFHPVRRIAMVSGGIAVIWSLFLAALTITGIPENGGPAFVAIFFRGAVILVFLVGFASVVGFLAYLLAYGGRVKVETIDPDVMPEKVEETGNPYQPSSF